MLIEVLIALALFGLSAVYLVDGAFVAPEQSG
jgi:prepilin-type N-terminal cleavage/methylation domain-containing protein